MQIYFDVSMCDAVGVEVLQNINNLSNIKSFDILVQVMYIQLYKL